MPRYVPDEVLTSSIPDWLVNIMLLALAVYLIASFVRIYKESKMEAFRTVFDILFLILGTVGAILLAVKLVDSGIMQSILALIFVGIVFHLHGKWFSEGNK